MGPSLLPSYPGKNIYSMYALRGSLQPGKRCDSAARRPPCPRVRRPHGALRASSPCSTPCVVGRYGRAVRALDGGGGSRSSSDKLPREKVEAAAAAKPSMRSPRVTRSSSSPSANGACCKPAVGAWARPHTLCIQAQLLVPRLRLHSFWQSSIHARPPGTRLQRNVGPPPRHVRPRAVRRSWCDDGNGGGDRCHEGAA